MPGEPAKAFDHLYGTLREYESAFLDTSLKACGFFILAWGWVLTSENARKLLTENKVLAMIGLVIPVIAAVVMASRVIRVTRHLHGELDALQHFPPSYYEFRIIKMPFAAAVMAVAISPCIVLIMFLSSKASEKDKSSLSASECICITCDGTQVVRPAGK